MNTVSVAFLFILQFAFYFDKAPDVTNTSPLPDSLQKLQEKNRVAANIIFKSTDGGQTWQDISEGLPENLQVDGFIEKK